MSGPAGAWLMQFIASLAAVRSLWDTSSHSRTSCRIEKLYILQLPHGTSAVLMAA